MSVDLLNRISIKRGKAISVSLADNSMYPLKYYNCKNERDYKTDLKLLIGNLLYGSIHISSLNDNTASLILAMDKVREYLKNTLGENDNITFYWENGLFRSREEKEYIEITNKAIEIFETEYFSKNEKGYYLVSGDRVLEKVSFNWQKGGIYRGKCNYFQELKYHKSMSKKKAIVISQTFTDFQLYKLA